MEPQEQRVYFDNSFSAAPIVEEGMTGWLIKRSGGVVKTTTQAQYILLFAAILFLTVAAFLMFNSGRGPAGDAYTPATEYGGRNIPDEFK